jgi:hypothetical protein
VEDGVDAVGKHGKGVLGHEEPDKGHNCFTSLAMNLQGNVRPEDGNVLRY